MLLLPEENQQPQQLLSLFRGDLEAPEDLIKLERLHVHVEGLDRDTPR